MSARVEGHVVAVRVGECIETVHAQVGAQDPLQSDAADARARESSEVLERCAAETR